MKDIVLYGGGGHCYAVVELIQSGQEYKISFICDDQPKEDSILTIPVKAIASTLPSALCITIGNNRTRKTISERLSQHDFPTFIHASVVKYPSVRIGKGSVVLPNSVLDAAVRIGDFCIINNNATVSHNVILENYVHVAINVALAGGVFVGEGTLLGAGCMVLPEVTIGKWATIGAGTVVTKDVPDYAVVYGNPGKIIKYNHKL